MDLTELLAFVVKNKASDLHLSSGLPPMIRVHGDVRRINVPPMEHKDVHAMIYDIMNDGQRKFYEENLECDFSFAVPNLARFRVNASGEGTKSGVAITEVAPLAKAIAALPRLRLRGLMAIPEPGAPARRYREVRQAYESMRREFDVDTLSMGMSDDLELAIAEGATLVRVGTAIFGERRTQRHAA